MEGKTTLTRPRANAKAMGFHVIISRTKARRSLFNEKASSVSQPEPFGLRDNHEPTGQKSDGLSIRGKSPGLYLALWGNIFPYVAIFQTKTRNELYVIANLV